MTNRKLALVLIVTFVLVLLGIGPAHTAQQPVAEKQRCEDQKEINDRAGKLEKSIEEVMQALSGETKPADPSASTPKSKQRGIVREGETAAELTMMRLEAAEKSLHNIASFLSNKDQKPGSKCRWVRECVYITCCEWGAPPSDPGTVKCMRQCCGAWENRLVCD